MEIGKILESIMRNNNIVGTISSVIVIIGAGFFFTKKKVIPSNCAGSLSKVILNLAIPTLSYNAFMQDIDSRKLEQSLSILVWGIVIHLVLIFLTKIFYKNYSGDRNDVLRMMTIFGSTTVFGIPVIQAVYGDTGAMYASVFNIPYRALLYTYGYMTIAGVKLKKENMGKIISNPIIVATFLGMFVWMFQNYFFQVSVIEGDIIRKYAFLRIDKTAYWLFKPMQYLASLNAPLSWLSIGITLAGVSFNDILKSKISWGYSVVKVVVIPVFLVALYTVMNMTGLVTTSYIALATIVLMMATPAATVIATYTIHFNKEPVLTSSCSLMSSIFSVAMIPFLIITIEILKSMGTFS